MEDTLIRVQQEEYTSMVNDYNNVAQKYNYVATNYNAMLDTHLRDSYYNMELMNNNTIIAIDNEAVIVHNQLIIVDLITYLSYMLGVIVLILILNQCSNIKLEQGMDKIKKLLGEDEEVVDDSYKELKDVNVKVIAV